MRLLAILLVAGCGRFRFDAIAAADADAYPDLVAWYTMDGLAGGTLVDATGHGHTGTCLSTTCPTTQTGQIGNALVFDGADDRIEVPDTPELELGVFTLATFYRTTGAKGCPLSKPLGLMKCNSWQFCTTTAGQTYFYTCDANEVAQEIDSVAFPALDTWHHAAIRFDGTTKSLFLDGVLDSNAQAAIGYDASPFVIGADDDFGATASFLTGSLDDVRVYSRALSDAEIAALAVP